MKIKKVIKMKNEIYQKVEDELKNLVRAYEKGELWDYVNNAIGITLKTDLAGDMVDYEIMTHSGGPTIWIEYGAIKGVWGGEEATLFVDREICDELWDILQEKKKF